MMLVRYLMKLRAVTALLSCFTIWVASHSAAFAATVASGPNILTITDSPTQCQIDGSARITGVDDDGRASAFDRIYFRLTNGATSAAPVGGAPAAAANNSQALSSARKDRTVNRTFTLIMDTLPAAGEQRWVHVVDRDNPQRNQIIGTGSQRITPAALRAAGPGFCTDVANALSASNTPPVADAGSDRTETEAAGVVLSLDASASTDVNMDALTYSWTQTSGTPVTLMNATSQMPSFSVPTSSSILVFEVAVFDGDATSTDTVAIDFTFIAGNTAPVANAGPDQVVDAPAGTVVTLDGSASSDDNADPLTYAWTQTSGPAVTLTNPTSANPTFVSPAADAIFTFSLVVDDGTDPSPADTVMVTYTVNDAPAADAGSDQTVTVTSGATVTLDGTSSSDPEGVALSYAWTQLSGPTVTLTGANTATPSFVVPDVSVITQLVFAVDVSDGSNTDRDTVTVTVEPRGSIRIVVQTAGVDGAFPFTSTVPALNATLQTTQGAGNLLATDVIAGAYTVDLGDVSGDGFSISSVTCDSNLSSGDAVTQRASINLEPGEEVTCTFLTVNSRDAAQREIRAMLTQRNTMLLANQPKLERRLERLRGSKTSPGRLTAGGFTVPGSEKLPLTMDVSDNSASVKTSLSSFNKSSSKPNKYDIWVEGTVSKFKDTDTEGKFNVVYVGADYLIGENALVGLMGQYDVFEAERSSDGRFFSDGTGFMVGPYATAKVGTGLYVDGRLAWGQSDNSITPLGTFSDSFDTNRYLASGSVTGEHVFENGFSIAPTLAVRHITEKQKEYTDSLNVIVTGQTVDLTTISLAPRFAKDFEFGSGTILSSYATAEGIYSSGDVAEGLAGDNIRGRFEGGLRFVNASGMLFDISAFADGLGASEFSNEGVRFSIGYVPR